MKDSLLMQTQLIALSSPLSNSRYGEIVVGELRPWPKLHVKKSVTVTTESLAIRGHVPGVLIHFFFVSFFFFYDTSCSLETRSMYQRRSRTLHSFTA